VTRKPSFDRDRGGFVLAVVVMMLFAISVAGAAGYLVVNSEFAMAKYADEGAEALAVARAGMQRFVSEQIGVVGDSVTYAIGGGVAMVTSRKMAAQDSVTDLYYLRAEGTVSDVFAPASPARRIVGAYAWHHRRPLRHWAALVAASATAVYAQNAGGRIDGVDQNTAADCPGGKRHEHPGRDRAHDGRSAVGGSARRQPGGQDMARRLHRPVRLG